MGSTQDNARLILHLDMDAFFAAVEQMDHPELRGKPLLVGGDGPRSVVCTASYEARPFGCRSAQPMAVAKRMCPEAIVVPVRHARYREVSRQVFEVLDAFSPVVEPLSIDEAFLEVTGMERLLGPPLELGTALKRKIREKTGIVGSVGIAPNKFLAKLASDMNKPDGLKVIRAQEAEAVLSPMPVTKMWGVGPATAERLERFGMRTIGDLRRAAAADLKLAVGDEADRYLRLAQGLDDRPVVPDRAAKSIGHEQTFEVDVADAAHVRSVLFEQVEQVARRVRMHSFYARTITLKIRYGQFETITRSATLDEPTDSTDLLWKTTAGIFDRWVASGFRPVRLIGMHVSGLGHQRGQLGLFTQEDQGKRAKLDQVTDKIARKFGDGSIKRGGSIEKP